MLVGGYLLLLTGGGTAWGGHVPLLGSGRRGCGQGGEAVGMSPPCPSALPLGSPPGQAVAEMGRGGDGPVSL